MAGYIGNRAVGINVTTGDILGNVAAGGDVSVGDDLTVTDDATIGGNLSIAAASIFYLDGTANSYITEVSADQIQFVAGGNEIFRIHPGTTTTTGDVDLLQAKHIRFKHQAGGTIRASISAESDDKLQFSTGSSETARMTIDTNGNVGIGDVPTGNLTAGYALRLDGGAQTFLAFNNNPHTTQVTGGFVIGNDNGAARITQRESQHVLFEVGGSEVLTLEVNKNVTIEDGNLVIGTSGHGIDFSAGAAGASTSNLLDEYEEGTWTPVIPNTTTAVFDGLTAKYVKIGANVSIFLSGQINLPSTDVATISGLPFTSSGNYGVTPYAAGQAIAADRNSISFVTNGTTLLVRSIGQTGATAAFTATNLTDNAFYHVQFVYGTNS